MIMPQRQTVLVAKQAAGLDRLCDGRFRLGVGVGWNEIEYEGLNENFHNRGRRSEEQVEVMRALWAQPNVKFKGRYHDINESHRMHIRAFDIAPSGALAKHTDRVFAELSGDEPGVPDGMKVDTAGNVYCGGPGGIWIMNATGKKLGRIVHGSNASTNMAFGGDDWKTLYFTTRHELGSVNVKIPGISVPAPAR